MPSKSYQLPFDQGVRKECVSTGAAGARTRRSLGHHLLHPVILRLLVLCAPAVLRPRALQDAPAPADPKSFPAVQIVILHDLRQVHQNQSECPGFVVYYVNYLRIKMCCISYKK